MTTVRRGLPRTRGGEGWPPAGIDPKAVEKSYSQAGAGPEPGITDSSAQTGMSTNAVPPTSLAGPSPAPERISFDETTTVGPEIRKGLPRVTGGDPWPPISSRMLVASPAGVHSKSHQLSEDGITDGSAPSYRPTRQAEVSVVDEPVKAPSVASEHQTPEVIGSTLRRGLPRVLGEEAWPPSGTTSVKLTNPSPAVVEATKEKAVPVAEPLVSANPDVPASQTSMRTDTPDKAPTHPKRARNANRRRILLQLLGAIAAGMVAVLVVFLARAMLSVPAIQDFLTRFPGEYQTPAAPGIASWVGWQHFFNLFLMVLIIRSGLRVRHEKRPEAYWTSRNGKTKISIALWLHQCLDILWLVNGLVFVVLLFLTGHWARLIPTSWDVFPNALSAALQYISFEWPVENGWNNYNSLQQLAYFTTVFVAAPLAALSGFRMSGMWPKRAERLSKVYPVEWARAVHYPVMLYFVVFIVLHVALVMLTGFLRNLNHMYAAQDADGWLGFWIFLGTVLLIVAGWVLARASLLSPIAGMFGKVSSR